jgi:hypothetical protein
METQSPESDEKQVGKTEKQIGFWKRQFQAETTKKQKLFDWIFGVILPVVCVVADPIVFKGYGAGKGALLAGYKPFGYLLSFTSIMLMMVWLIWGTKLKWLNSFLSGLFAVGSFISFAIGIIFFPLSVIGIFFVIGIFGFTPLFASFVYWRNSVRTFHLTKPFLKKGALIGSFVLSAVLSFTIPMLVNVKIQNLLNQMNNGNAETIKLNAEKLKYFYPLVNFDVLGGHYCDSPQSEEHQALAEVYQRFTGESVERIDFHICEDF